MSEAQTTLYPELPPTKSGTYYSTDGIRIKIGHSDRPPKIRGGELGTDILLFIPDEQTTEAREHRRWASARIGRTEWFNVTFGLIAYIARHIDPHDWVAMNALNCLIINNSGQAA